MNKTLDRLEQMRKETQRHLDWINKEIEYYTKNSSDDQKVVDLYSAPLSVRTTNVLHAYFGTPDILRDWLINLSYEDLMATPRVGTRMVAEVNRWLLSIGIELKGY